ncbi:MAG: type II toxin-antitoxin system RelE/ParE family toxin [Candidatus Algichlamydia australiensis]|nr:type II toxin-antitoxin system RelE/ParE family toxin [Chlamydiales bacterium]
MDKAGNIYKTEEYDEWFDQQQGKSQFQILKRLSLIQEEGYFGDHKDLREGVWELRWKNGRRVYYAYIPEKDLLLLLGGNKNGQSKDIKKAKKILKEYVDTK